MPDPPASDPHAARLGPPAPAPPHLQVRGPPPQGAVPLVEAPRNPAAGPRHRSVWGPKACPVGHSDAPLRAAAQSGARAPPPPPSGRGPGRGTHHPAELSCHRHLRSPLGEAPPGGPRRPPWARGPVPHPGLLNEPSGSRASRHCADGWPSEGSPQQDHRLHHRSGSSPPRDAQARPPPRERSGAWRRPRSRLSCRPVSPRQSDAALSCRPLSRRPQRPPPLPPRNRARPQIRRPAARKKFPRPPGPARPRPPPPRRCARRQKRRQAARRGPQQPPEPAGRRPLPLRRHEEPGLRRPRTPCWAGPEEPLRPGRREEREPSTALT